MKPQSITALAIVFLGLIAAVISVNNGAGRPLKGHEIFVAQTASEMIAGGDYLIPHYNGHPRMQKPPLAYWLAAGAHRIFGHPDSPIVTEFESRISSVISGLLLLAVTFLLGQAAFGDRRIGLAAAGILGTSWIFFSYARNARPEMLYALFCALQMLGLVIAVKRAQAGRASFAGAALAWAATAGALLAKGPQFPVFLIAGAVLALRLAPTAPRLRAVLHPWLAVAAIALVVPYYAYLAFNVEDALAIWSREVVQETPVPLWLRPFRLYPPWSLVTGLVPWIALLGYAVVHSWKRRDLFVMMMALPIVITLVCLSFVGKLRPHYVLPVVPLTAVLIAWASVELFDRARFDANARRLARRLLTVQAALIGVLVIALAALSLRDNPVSALPMWRAASPWLAVAAAIALAALRLPRRRPTAKLAVLGVSVLAASAAVSSAGLDVSRYWATADEFATQVARTVPERALIAYHGVHSAAMIYYGHRIGPQVPLDQWAKTHALTDLPWLVCKRSCALDGRPVEGQVVLRQRDIGQGRILVLLKPEPSHLLSRLTVPTASDPEPAGVTTAPSRP